MMMLRASTRAYHNRLNTFRPRYFSASSSVADKPFVVGIARETYDHSNWERRAPLTPRHVKELLKHHHRDQNIQVVVQPSTHRIFSNCEYEAAGATIQDDLSSADLILGVKRPRSTRDIYPNTTYAMFAHVHKGQAENMGLLQTLLDKKSALLDYECITTTDTEKPQRLVAFGKFAGLAGMTDTLQTLGKHLLSDGYTTPFLNCPPTICHATLDDAKMSVSHLGERIAADGLELSPISSPLVFAMTGKGGNVHSGVKEIFELLPHEIVSVDELPDVIAQNTTSVQKKVYGLHLGTCDLYRSIQEADKFDREHFQSNPSAFKSIFASDIAPYVSVLINGAYWDARFPKLLTKENLFDLYHTPGKDRLMLISDISCDIQGSVECLLHSTSIDKPSFIYDPISGQEIEHGRGITIMGVDILPTELPVESSEHFGDAIVKIIPEMAQSRDSAGTISIDQLSTSLANAFISDHEGSLRPNYRYIDSILKRVPKVSAIEPDEANILVVLMYGHLFDSGLINQVLDMLDNHGCGFEFKEVNVRHREPGTGDPIKSSATLEIHKTGNIDFDQIERKIQALVIAIESADATYAKLDARQARGRSAIANVTSLNPEKRVLLLGSGMVSKSAAELLGRTGANSIVVASNDNGKAREVAGHAVRGEHICFDIGSDDQKLSKLIRDADAVVSLLPVPMHPRIAEFCINSRTDLVTASYESDAMRKLGPRAMEAGIKVLNEVGLDPGLDHMSAMKIIDDVRERGGSITSFVSACGGLPAPESADNPLKYKFSWSPRGVITASQNAAKYRWEDHVVEVYGKELLQNAAPFVDGWPDLHLECLPNRNSLDYESTYGIDDARTVFRGTLRYAGFSSLMHIFRNMGFFDSIPVSGSTWNEVLENMRLRRGGFVNVDDFLLACADEKLDDAARAKECLQWLGMWGAAPVQRAPSMLDLFCSILEEKLQYGTGERDMVVMHHAIDAEFEDGTVEQHRSSLQSFGDESMSAMCKSVGYTAAAAANLLLDGALVNESGLLLPTNKLIYEPILSAVEKEGIAFQESVRVKEHSSSANNPVKAHPDTESMEQIFI